MMTSWMNNLRGLRPGQRNYDKTQTGPGPRPNATTSPSGLSPANMSPVPASPSALSVTAQVNNQAQHANQTPKGTPFFFREQYANFTVKGNFMTLAAKPALVDEGEWIAHQLVEQNRLLGTMMDLVIFDIKEQKSFCTNDTCPSMHAGPITYTWLDSNGNPMQLPAPMYMKHIRAWVSGKIQDLTLFPTDTFTMAPPGNRPEDSIGKTSGFPQRFYGEVKNMYKQMFRCYAHLYWSHWLQLYDVSSERELNTCFVHFINVGRLFGLLTDKDMEPMMPLVDQWIKKSVLPDVEKKGEDVKREHAPLHPSTYHRSTTAETHDHA